MIDFKLDNIELMQYPVHTGENINELVKKHNTLIDIGYILLSVNTEWKKDTAIVNLCYIKPKTPHLTLE